MIKIKKEDVKEMETKLIHGFELRYNIDLIGLEIETYLLKSINNLYYRVYYQNINAFEMRLLVEKFEDIMRESYYSLRNGITYSLLSYSRYLIKRRIVNAIKDFSESILSTKPLTDDILLMIDGQFAKLQYNIYGKTGEDNEE